MDWNSIIKSCSAESAAWDKKKIRTMRAKYKRIPDEKFAPPSGWTVNDPISLRKFITDGSIEEFFVNSPLNYETPKLSYNFPLMEENDIVA